MAEFKFDFGTYYNFTPTRWVHTISTKSDKDANPRVLVIHAVTQENSRRSIAITTGGYLDDVPVYLYVHCGERIFKDGERLENAAGVLSYHSAKPDAEYPSKEFVSGWFWLSEPNFERLWAQSTLQTVPEAELRCELQMLDSPAGTYVWDIAKNQGLLIRDVGISFFREQKPSETPDQTEKRKSSFLDRLTR